LGFTEQVVGAKNCDRIISHKYRAMVWIDLYAAVLRLAIFWGLAVVAVATPPRLPAFGQRLYVGSPNLLDHQRY
jgi:hypothetical protein